LQATTVVARSAEEDIVRAGLPGMTVGYAFTAEAANSNMTAAKVFSLPPDKFFSSSEQQKNEALHYTKQIISLY
jgi:hypothetical protein